MSILNEIRMASGSVAKYKILSRALHSHKNATVGTKRKWARAYFTASDHYVADIHAAASRILRDQFGVAA